MRRVHLIQFNFMNTLRNLFRLQLTSINPLPKPNMIASIVVLLCSFCLWPIFLAITLINESIRLLLSILYSGRGLSLVQDGLDNVIRFKAGRTSRYFVVNLYSSPMTNEAASLSRERELWEKKVFSKKESNGSKTYAKLMNIFTTRFGYTWFFNGSKQFKIENHVRLYDHIPQLGGPIAEDQVAEKLMPHLLEDMDESKPQWEWLIVPQVLRKDGTICSLRMFRIDHGYMDGASVAQLLANCLFDWNNDGEEPKFIVDPRLFQSLPWKMWGAMMAKDLSILPWAALQSVLSSPKECHLPLAVNKYGGSEDAVYSNFVTAKINRPQGTGIDAFLATVTARAAYKWCGTTSNKVDGSPLNVAYLKAIPPFASTKPRNRIGFTIAETKNCPSSWIRGDPAMASFIYLFSQWAGRFPEAILAKLCKPGNTTVSFNNATFTKEKGAIDGQLISQIGVWSNLYLPGGVGLTILSYGGESTISAYSVKQLMSRQELQKFVDIFVGEINKASGLERCRS